MTWKKEYTPIFAYPRFIIEKEYLDKFKEDCRKRGLIIEIAIRQIIIRYMKSNNILPMDLPEQTEPFYKYKKKINQKRNINI